MPSELKLLIISFYFPPYNKVGGRRWAKHFKYLIKENLDAFVIAGNYMSPSPWDKDIFGLEDRIFRVEHAVNIKPFHLTDLPNNFSEKIKWKYSYYKWELLKKKLDGNYNDPALNNIQNYLNTAIEVIREKKINAVILSVGPFKYANILISLKAQFPNIKFVLDYRDYWEDSLIGLTERQVKVELENQQRVINCVDLILSPNQEMQNYYAKKFNKPSYLLPHCIDEDDLKIKSLPQKKNGFNLIYGGAFYHSIHNNISLIKSFLDLLANQRPVEADFYVSVKGYEKELQHPNIKRYDFIDANAYFEKVIAADYVILILPPNRVNAMSSKFFEIVAFRKPILYFGNEGEVSNFILKNKLGFHITSRNMHEQVALCIDNLANPLIPDLSYNISEHTFNNHTKKLIDQLTLL